MTPTTASSLRAAATVLSSLIIIFPAIWGGFALWYQLHGSQFFKGLCVVLWGTFSIAMLTALWQGRFAVGVIAFTVALVGLLVWWTRLTPTNDHEWADDVARITTGTVGGSRRTVDMIMSYWKGPVIAHMLISFGFDDGEQVVFSVEVRRQKTQAFSEIGGFFKEFELSIIAAAERDVVRLRTNVRGEDVYLYRLQLPQEAMRSLFLGYVGEANSLVDSPRFYNTITVNCTTLVYQMMKRIVGRLPLDYRLLFSGYLPEYVYRVGGLDRSYSLEELRRRGRLSERARISDRSDSFSADIRRGIP
jgi:hypothetical protein